MVADIGESETGRDAALTGSGSQQHGLGCAPVGACRSHRACLVALGAFAADIGVVAKTVAHRVKQGDSDGGVIGVVRQICSSSSSESDDSVTVAIDKPGWREPCGVN